MKKALVALAVSAGITAIPAHAEWKGSAELGATNSAGNTETTIVNLKADLNHKIDKWQHDVFADAYYAEDSGTKTAERYALGYKPRYFITDKDYAFGLGRYDKDKFAFIDQRTTEVIGYGRKLVVTDVHNLEAEIGLGARQTNYVDDPATDGLKKNEGMAFLGGKYEGKISQTSKFTEVLRVEMGEENTFVESVTGLSAAIAGNLSAKISYTVRHNTDIEGAKGEKTDTLTGVNVLYSF